MKFLYPQFLYALFTVLTPVIIHLFNFQRHKKVHFSNVAFLKEVKHTTKARSTLKHLLILISRMLAITALVLAFAQPFFPIANQSSIASKSISSSVFFDNSFSMENQNTNGRIFDIAREFSYQLIDKLPSHVNHQLLTNAFTGAEQHLYPSAEILKKIEVVQVGPTSKLLSDIIHRQTTAFDETNFNGFVISDFQKSQYDFTEIIPDTHSQYTLIPIEPIVSNNVAIDSIWFKNPVHRINQPEEIHFRLRNYSQKANPNLRVSLTIDEEQKAFGNVTIPAESYLDTFLVYINTQTGGHQGVLEIKDSPVRFDNSFYFNFNILNEIKVLTISSAESQNYIQRAFEVDPYFNYTELNENSIDFNALANTDVLILNGITKVSSGMTASITKFVQNGGDLIVFPSKDPNQAQVNTILKTLQISALGAINKDTTRINYIDLEHKVYQNVFTSVDDKINLPNIYLHFSQRQTKSLRETTLLQTINKQKILTNWKVKKGDVYLFTVALNTDFSNLPLHSIFLPTLFQVAFTSANYIKPYHVIGDDEIIQASYHAVNNELYHITNAEKTIDVIPEMNIVNNSVQLNMHQAIQQAGNYNLLIEDSLMEYVSLNYPRLESNPVCYTSNELSVLIDSLGLTNFTVLNSSLDEFSDDYDTNKSGIELWRWFIIITLMFIAIEIILIRYFKPSIL